MDGGNYGGGELRCDRLAPVLGYPELFAQQSLGGGGSESYDHARVHQPDLLLEPWIAGANLAGTRFLVQPPASLDDNELEVLDGVGDVHLAAIDSGLLQSLIQQSSCGPNERMPLTVLLIAGLLTDQHDLGGTRSLTKHGLCRVHPEIAATAPGGRFA